MVDLASKIKAKILKKAHTYASLNAHAILNTHSTKTNNYSSYPMMDKVISRFANVFEMDYALLNILGGLSKFKPFHPKRQCIFIYHPNAYFR